MLSQELENAQLELENLCKQKSLVSRSSALPRFHQRIRKHQRRRLFIRRRCQSTAGVCYR